MPRSRAMAGAVTLAVRLPRLSREGAQAVGGALAALVLWELAARGLAGSYLLAGPVDVARYLQANSGLMGRALAITLENAALGFVAGNLAAVALALVVVLIPRSQPVVAGFALVVFCLPLVATGPILRVLYGPGPGPQITLAALAVYYTTFIPLMVGLRAAPASWFDLMRVYGRGAWTAFVQVRVMAALPYLLAGLQIAAPAAFLGAMVGEFTGAERGMGVLALRAMRGLDVEATWALATVAAVVAMLAYGALGWVARALAPARPEVLLAPPPATALSGRAGRALRGAGVAALTLVLMLALWWGVMEAFGLSRFFAKRPDDLWAFLVSAPTAAENRAILWEASAQTLTYVLPGYLAGLGLGAVLAMVLVLAPGLAGAVLPVAVALRSVPIVTTAPLIVLALGRGAAGTITIVAVMIFFPALVACLQGLRQAPGQVLDVMATYGAGRLTRLIHARLPAMLPAFFAAARMSVPAAVLAVTVAEWLATGTGLGNLMALTASTSNYNLLWSAVVLVALGSAAGYALVGAVERRVLARVAPEQLR
ncbi:ABC transporter permease [Rhabdonatronobacter sediminivivens]|nr:ABC transporter permease subunit [Rhabdonatronobacter sediminivivens]